MAKVYWRYAMTTLEQLKRLDESLDSFQHPLILENRILRAILKKDKVIAKLSNLHAGESKWANKQSVKILSG